MLLKEMMNELFIIKATPRKIMLAENELVEELNDLFEKVKEKVLNELKDKGVTDSPVQLSLMLKSFEDIKEEYANIIVNNSKDMTQYGRERVINDAKNLGIAVTLEVEISDRVFEQYWREVNNVSKETIDRLSTNVYDNLKQSYVDGVGQDEAAERLKENFSDIENFELRRIARTEINSAQNYGAQITMRDMNVEFQQWITAKDSRVREQHEEMDGEITRIDEKFSNGLRYPCDKNGAIEQWINCRCRAVPFLIPKGKSAPNKQWFYESDII